jgi:hypothetical protein
MSERGAEVHAVDLTAQGTSEPPVHLSSTIPDTSRLVPEGQRFPDPPSRDLRPVGECNGCGTDKRHVNRCCPDCDCHATPEAQEADLADVKV